MQQSRAYPFHLQPTTSPQAPTYNLLQPTNSFFLQPPATYNFFQPTTYPSHSVLQPTSYILPNLHLLKPPASILQLFQLTPSSSLQSRSYPNLHPPPTSNLLLFYLPLTTYSLQPITCNLQPPTYHSSTSNSSTSISSTCTSSTCISQPATCNLQPTTYNLQLFNLQLVSLQLATLQLANL